MGSFLAITSKEASERLKSIVALHDEGESTTTAVHSLYRDCLRAVELGAQDSRLIATRALEAEKYLD